MEAVSAKTTAEAVQKRTTQSKGRLDTRRFMAGESGKHRADGKTRIARHIIMRLSWTAQAAEGWHFPVAFPGTADTHTIL